MEWKRIKETASEIAKNLKPATSGWARTHCPFCIDRVGRTDRRQSLAFYAPYGFFRCFRCGIRVSLKGWDASHVQIVYQPIYKSSSAPKWFVPLFDGSENSQTFSAARDYAESRGYDLALRTSVGMGACSEGIFNTRIVIPHRDANGEWWGFTARNWLGKCEEPYRYPTGMDRARMFNEQALYVNTSDPALIMEGVCDGILYWPDPVTCGGKPIDAQFEVFARTLRPLAIILDGDAWEEGWRTSLRLQLLGIPAGSVRLPPGRDPNDRLYVDVHDVRRAAIECIGKQVPVVVEEKIRREETYV